MHDDILGTLTWNASTGSWEASVAVTPDSSVGISLIPLTEDLAPLIEHARGFIDEFTERDRELRQVAADCLLSDFLDSWSDGQSIAAGEFMNRMSIDGVCFWPGGKAEAYYFDGGLFGGHMIVIPFQNDGAIDEAYIAG
jgi:hypothetical protein